MFKFKVIVNLSALFITIASQTYDPEVLEIESVIFNATINAFLGPAMPEDARMYEPIDETPIDYGEYDFVVIGAGSTGAVIANRLSEIDNWKVLLLEAGKYPNKLTEIPRMYGLALFTNYNWRYRTIPQTTSCLGMATRRCYIDAGKGVGGTSLINGLFYVRGHPIDNDMWAQLVDDPSWSYEQILKYYVKSENFRKPLHQGPYQTVNWKYHGTGGLSNVEHHRPRNQLTEAFLEANIELGYNITDYNSPDQVGGSITQYNTKFGRRQDQGTTFILPFLNRKNLKVLPESYVTKIDIDSETKEAKGVVFTRNGKTFRVRIRKEAILSAGTLSSPRILMHSGVGPKDHLEELGITVIQNLPVGKTLRNHIALIGLQFTTNVSLVQQTLGEQIEDYLRGVGILASASSASVIGRYKTNVEKLPTYTDMELLGDFSYGMKDTVGEILDLDNQIYDNLLARSPNNNVYWVPMLMRSYSVGTVKLKSRSPFEYPLIDSNLFNDPKNKDIKAMYQGIKIIFDLLKTEAFQKIGAGLHEARVPACEGHQYLSKSYWYCFLRHMSMPGYHPMSTCATGKSPEQGAVVDSKLRVFRIRKLRVADASIFPFSLTGHPNAICVMVGEKISDEIKSDYTYI